MPMTSLLQRLSAERNRRFVGRGRELELFHHAIASQNYLFTFCTSLAPVVWARQLSCISFCDFVNSQKYQLST
jgi:hypothetical protein